ncbi:acyltransferase [uncultured Acetobacteroides sp.]|uniref:acyltransferase family protein n=1 Tax=uncultured Acetobacteroides sp. TaxID=1760811 RepID=UPI0029F46AEC|nr:acyltransferase [uncultured Acetobacteroides sp.]
MSASSLTPKPHYEILDGLRGVAAVLVVAFHILEVHAQGHVDLLLNHAYLAVDFFFLLSGFVIGYAYDDRWGSMSPGGFFKRRLIRLQPLVVMGAILGAALFFFQRSDFWPMVAVAPAWKVMLVMLVGCTMLPLLPAFDIRGGAEMYPLNGPAWSLFYEYVANILYALFVRRFSTTLLAVLVVLSGGVLVHLAVTGPACDVIGGWSLELVQIRYGLTRVVYPFFAGLLLFRIGKPARVEHGFLLSSLLLVVLLVMPRLGEYAHLWMNGIYESVTIVVLFPLVVFIGASSQLSGKLSTTLCRFLGEISYPIYITHFPLVELYRAWVFNHKLTLRESYPLALLVFALAIVLAYACLKLYDEPARRWLRRRFSGEAAPKPQGPLGAGSSLVESCLPQPDAFGADVEQ